MEIRVFSMKHATQHLSFAQIQTENDGQSRQVVKQSRCEKIFYPSFTAEVHKSAYTVHYM